MSFCKLLFFHFLKNLRKVERHLGNMERNFHLILISTDNSCARVNAVYVPKFGKSRLKVSRVYNTHGPQTHMTSGHSAVLGGGDMDSWMRAWEESLEERLGNVEHHLKLSRGKLKQSA